MLHTATIHHTIPRIHYADAIKEHIKNSIANVMNICKSAGSRMQIKQMITVCLTAIAAAALPTGAIAGSVVLLSGGLTSAKLIFILFFLPIIVVTATLVIVMAGAGLLLTQNGRPGYPRTNDPPKAPLEFHLPDPHTHSIAHSSAAIAHFAQDVKPGAREQLTIKELQFKELVMRRQQLIDMRSAEKNRLVRAYTAQVQEEVRQHIAELSACIKAIYEQLHNEIENDPTWNQKLEIISSYRSKYRSQPSDVFAGTGHA